MSSKYKNKRRAIQENLSIDAYVFLSYYISNVKHICPVIYVGPTYCYWPRFERAVRYIYGPIDLSCSKTSPHTIGPIRGELAAYANGHE